MAPTRAGRQEGSHELHASQRAPPPCIMQNYPVPGTANGAQRVTREQACGSRTNQNKFAKHAHTQHHKQHHSTTVRTNNPASTSSRKGIMAEARIPAQQMRRTDTREAGRAGLQERKGMGQDPLVEHTQHAPQPRSIAWGGGGAAAIKAVSHLLGARELLGKSF